MSVNISSSFCHNYNIIITNCCHGCHGCFITITVTNLHLNSVSVLVTLESQAHGISGHQLSLDSSGRAHLELSSVISPVVVGLGHECTLQNQACSHSASSSYVGEGGFQRPADKSFCTEHRGQNILAAVGGKLQFWKHPGVGEQITSETRERKRG